MADEIIVEGTKYISSKRASESTGYTQDYIGQLARKGTIDSKRIGGLWYISMDSLFGYKDWSETNKAKSSYTPSAATPTIEAIVSFDGKDYISATRASELTGYHQDYVGQLARGGKVQSRQIGNRWYVERQGILNHKREKDALLAAVQAEAVGLPRAHGSLTGVSEKTVRESLYNDAGPHFTYTKETSDLLPILKPVARERSSEEHKVPIRILGVPEETRRDTRNAYTPIAKSRFGTGLSWITAATATIVIVLAVGYVSASRSARYAELETMGSQSAVALVSGASEVFSTVLNAIEDLVSPEVYYQRDF